MRRSLRSLIVACAFVSTAVSANTLLAAPPPSGENLYQQIKDYWATPLVEALKPEALQQMLLPYKPEDTKPYVTIDGVVKASWAERIKQRNSSIGKNIIDILKDPNFRNNQGERSDHVYVVSNGTEGLDPTNPDVAYDSMNQRYFMVWEEETSPGIFNILGQFRDRMGAPVGMPVLISSPRSTQGCFYASFDAENGAISTPNNCPKASNPSVSYNNGRYLVVWELKGRATVAHNSDGSDNNAGKNFSNIIGKVLNAENLEPISPAWREGILISRVTIASNVVTRVANDSQVQAWAQSLNPDVAPKLGGDGFLVTWQSDKDFIGCVDPARRVSSSVFARYVDQNFSSATMGTSNKPVFTVYTDPSTLVTPSMAMPNCSTLDNVMKAVNPRIAFNSARSDFVVAFQHARASSATKGDIAAKKITLNAENNATVSNNMAADLVAVAPEGSTFYNPDIASYGPNTLLAYDNGSNIFMKSLNANATAVTPMGEGREINLGGSGVKTEPRIGTNLSVGGTRGAANAYPERALLAYRQGEDMRWALTDNAFSVLRGPGTFPVMANANHQAEVASDANNFFVAWAGMPMDSMVENVFGMLVNSLDDFEAPVLTAPANAAVLNETSVTLSWNAVSGPGVVYDVYLGVGAVEPTIVSMAQTTTSYNAMGLAYGSNYTWRVVARDATGRTGTSMNRTFRLVDGLGAPSLLTPANGAMILESSVNLTWGPVSGTGVVYDVYFGEGSGEPAVRMSNVSVTNFSVAVMPGRAYRWKVVAKDSLMRNASSEVRSFSTIPSFSSMVTLTAPAAGAVVPTSSVNLTWMAVPGTGVVYDVYHATGAGALAIVSTGQTTTSYMLSGMTSQSAHQWKVVARDSLRRMAESEVRMFTVGNLNMPTIPALAAQPADNVTWAPTRLYLSWMGSTDADVGDTVTYDVYFEEVPGAMSPLPADAIPYRSGIPVGTTNFIIQASTDNRAQYSPNGMHAGTQTFLEPNSHYAWKVCANDGRSNPAGISCSPVRHFNTDNSVVGWWRFDENPVGVVCPGILGGPAGDAGETVCDYSGYGNHGRPNGMPMWLAPNPMLLGGALRFDGVDDYVSVSDSPSLDLTAQLTIEVYENLQALGGATLRPLITKLASGDASDATGYNFTFRTGAELLLSIDSIGSGRFVEGNIPMAVGTLKNLVGTYDGVNGKIYDNAVLSITRPIIGDMGTNNQPLLIGRTFSVVHLYNGTISEALVYNRALTDTEIQSGFRAKQ